jgi:hypothetical protein
MWRRVDSQVDSNVSEKQTAPSFSYKYGIIIHVIIIIIIVTTVRFSNLPITFYVSHIWRVFKHMNKLMSYSSEKWNLNARYSWHKIAELQNCFEHVLRMQTYRIPRKIFKYHPKGRSDRGRPPMRWINCLTWRSEQAKRLKPCRWWWWWWWYVHWSLHAVQYSFTR